MAEIDSQTPHFLYVIFENEKQFNIVVFSSKTAYVKPEKMKKNSVSVESMISFPGNK